MKKSKLDISGEAVQKMHIVSGQFNPDMDVWNAAQLGMQGDDVHGSYCLTFGDIEPEWLKCEVKRFIRYSSSMRKFNTLAAYLKNLKLFSSFVCQTCDYFHPESINRALIIEFISFLSESRLGPTARNQALIHLRRFFDVASENNWMQIPPGIIKNSDLPRAGEVVPRFIPDAVLEQLNTHIEILPPPIMRLILVLEETGLRVGEVLRLPLRCIEQDSRGNWFLRHMNFKMYREQLKPISNELAKIIQVQQKYIEKELHYKLDGAYDKLFCAIRRGNTQPSPKTMNVKQLQRHLADLVARADIRDESGKRWKFEAHQFRHSVGTRLINMGVPLQIIQKYLGHRSPEMTLRYAHIHDKTMQKQLKEYLDNSIVNIRGEVSSCASTILDNDIEAQYLRENVLAQALPNGACSRPVIKGPCPHANACLTCGDFRTSKKYLSNHRKQLLQTEELIERAKGQGWARQVEMNEQVKTNLLNIINTLEEL